MPTLTVATHNTYGIVGSKQFGKSLDDQLAFYESTVAGKIDVLALQETFAVPGCGPPCVAGVPALLAALITAPISYVLCNLPTYHPSSKTCSCFGTHTITKKGNKYVYDAGIPPLRCLSSGLAFYLPSGWRIDSHTFSTGGRREDWLAGKGYMIAEKDGTVIATLHAQAKDGYDDVRLDQLREVVQAVEQRRPTVLAVIMGDFNIDRHDPDLVARTSAVFPSMQNWQVLFDPVDGSDNTSASGKHVDNIFYRTGTDVTDVTVNRQAVDHTYSDHSLLFARFSYN